MEIPPKYQSQKADPLQIAYADKALLAEKLIVCLREQLTALFEQNDIALGVPMESRVKALSSIQEKITRKPDLSLDIGKIEDIAGIRLILLFSRDVEKLDTIIRDTLVVLSSESAIDRLSESEFGYQSNHYIATIPDSWTKVPSNSGLGGQKVEIQVRTMAQHIWAAASHKLQYKHEGSVPPPIRRAINRVSALLETVDLEFSRVLDQRENYIKEIDTPNIRDEELNSDLIDRIFRDIYPKENFDDDSDDQEYDELISELSEIGIKTYGQLEKILKDKLKMALTEDRKRVSAMDPDEVDLGDENRYYRGVFFTPVGLARISIADYKKKKKHSTGE